MCPFKWKITRNILFFPVVLLITSVLISTFHYVSKISFYESIHFPFYIVPTEVKVS